MDEQLLTAYRQVIDDLSKRSETAQAAERRNTKFIQSLENTRAVLIREAELEEWR